MGAGHTYMNAWVYTHLYTRNSTQHCPTEGGKVGRAANQGGNTAERKQKTVPLCTHTSKEAHNTSGA